MRLILALASLALLVACSQADVPPCPHTGAANEAPSAGCLVVVHGRLLVVENHRGKVSPPGGKTKNGESAQCAAHRETWEETGLDLLPGELVATFDTGFHLYYCGIHAASGPIAPRAASEIGDAFWLPIEDVDQVAWRYEGQGEVLRKLLLPE